MVPRSAQSLAALGMLALVAFAAYGALLTSGFPLEEESLPWLRQFGRTPWPAVPFLASYHNVAPVGNLVLRLAADVYAFDVRAGQALGLLLVVAAGALVGRLAHGLLGDGRTALVAACLFAGSTAYYHLVLSPVNVCAAGMFYVMVLAALVLAVDAARGRRGWIATAVLGALLPLQFYGAPTFLPLLAATLWATRVDLRPHARAVAGVALAHLAVLGVAQVFLTGLFSTHFVESGLSTPSRYGLTEALVAHPFQYVAIVGKNSAGAWLLGLVAPFFLLTPPAGVWGVVGVACLALWIVGLITWRDGRRANAALLAMTMVPLLVTCVLRNPFNAERGAGAFDLYWVVSMPRYYFFPSVGLAMSVAASVLALGARLGAPGRTAATAFLALLLVGNVVTTREKLSIVAQSTPPGEPLPSEVYRFTSPLAPRDRPAADSRQGE